jgi:hypothetical protein
MNKERTVLATATALTSPSRIGRRGGARHLWRRRSRLIGTVGVLSTLACMALAAAQALWTPNEILISAQADLLDPEFNQSRSQFAWNSVDGKLWVGNVDSETGLFYPPDGKGILVDADTFSAADATKTGNGPEWVWTADGDGIAYSKFKGSRRTDANLRLGYARPLADGTWTSGFLGPDVARKAPYGSETAGDASPRISYVDKDNFHYWRELDDPASEQLLPGTPMKIGPVRFVRGAARAVIYPALASTVEQVFFRDLDSGRVQQLTFDAGKKDQMWMWQAPEFGNAFVLMTMVGGTELRFYRELPDASTGAPAWTPFHTAIVPRRLKVQSPEPFVFNGRSYAVFQVAVGANSFASEIWISNMDPASPLLRRISDNVLLRARTDPEVFITANRGPMVYYNRRQLQPDGKFCPGVACSEGVYAADAGLGPKR